MNKAWLAPKYVRLTTNWNSGHWGYQLRTLWTFQTIHRHVWSQRVFSVNHHVQKCSHLASPATLDREGGLLSSEKLGLENIVKVKWGSWAENTCSRELELDLASCDVHTFFFLTPRQLPKTVPIPCSSDPAFWFDLINFFFFLHF